MRSSVLFYCSSVHRLFVFCVVDKYLVLPAYVCVFLCDAIVAHVRVVLPVKLILFCFSIVRN